MKIRIYRQTTITDAKPETIQEIRCQMTFRNQAFLENERRGYSNWQTDRLIQCFHVIPGGLVFPRGFSGSACRIARQHGEQLQITNCRRSLPEVSFYFTDTLKSFQQEAVDDVLQKPFGTLAAATGSGKTFMALAVIAERKQPALVVVHTKELLEQWTFKIETFLKISRAKSGIAGGGWNRIGNKITVALVQSLAKHIEDVYEHVRFLIVDECH